MTTHQNPMIYNLLAHSWISAPLVQPIFNWPTLWLSHNKEPQEVIKQYPFMRICKIAATWIVEKPIACSYSRKISEAEDPIFLCGVSEVASQFLRAGALIVSLLALCSRHHVVIPTSCFFSSLSEASLAWPIPVSDYWLLDHLFKSGLPAGPIKTHVTVKQ